MMLATRIHRLVHTAIPITDVSAIIPEDDSHTAINVAPVWRPWRQRSVAFCTSLLLLFSITACACRSPERELPTPQDAKYAQIEQMIEQTLHPEIRVFAARLSERSPEVITLESLGYLQETSQGIRPSAFGRKIALLDNWPGATPNSSNAYNEEKFIIFSIGTYNVYRLLSAAHYDGAPCGAYGEERDEYQFIANVSLNRLGQSLLRKRLLFAEYYAPTSVRRWDGQHPLEGLWSDNAEDKTPNHKYADNRGEFLDLASAIGLTPKERAR